MVGTSLGEGSGLGGLSIQKKNIQNFLFFLFFLFVNEFFFLADNKLSGFPFVREAFILFLVLLFLKNVFFDGYFIGLREEYFVVLYVFGWILFSALLSFFNHGQPIIYGFLEERRLLLYLVFFPVLYLIVYRNVSFETLGFYLVAGFCLASLVGFLYSFGVLNPRVDLSFKVDGKSYQDVQEMYEGFRGGRFRIATAFLLWVFIYSLLQFRKTGRYFWISISGYCAAYVWIVIQTRTMMATMLIIALVIFRKRLDRVLSIAWLGLPLVLSVVFIYPELILNEYEKLLDLYHDVVEHSGPRTRELTIGIILDEVWRNPLGFGALSLQWKEGFLSIYNDNFYLSDVGIFGVVYRFGLFSIPLIVLYYYVFLGLGFRLLRTDDVLVLTACYVVVFESLDFIFSSSMAMGGSLFGVALAIMVAHKYRLNGNWRLGI